MEPELEYAFSLYTLPKLPPKYEKYKNLQLTVKTGKAAQGICIICIIVLLLDFTTVELQWLEHRWLVYHGYFKLVLESLGNIPIAADIIIFRII